MQEDEEAASEHVMDLKATHLHIALVKMAKRVGRRAPKRKQAGEAEAKEEAAAGASGTLLCVRQSQAVRPLLCSFMR